VNTPIQKVSAFKKNAADTMVEAKSDMSMKDIGIKNLKDSEA